MSEPAARPVILVSACLVGVRCRYDGETKAEPRVIALAERATLVPVCPEQLGGMPTPRVRHERVGERIVSESGCDATEAFDRGAQQALVIARICGATRAVLKARSPSCGVGVVYDGTFTGRLMQGDGVLAALLRSEGITSSTEDDLPPA
jgi:uncharacterized protein YbbK (DUF523 family)